MLISVMSWAFVAISVADHVTPTWQPIRSQKFSVDGFDSNLRLPINWSGTGPVSASAAAKVRQFQV